MDIVSYGLANKVASDIKHVHENILGLGVEGNHPNMKSRIDALEKTIEGVNETANRLIVNNAINLMKAHAKLNFVEKSIKYNMHHMIFDDLLDLSGIDTNLSAGYLHSSEQGWLQSIDDSCTIVTLPEITATVPEKVILTAQIEQNKFENVIPPMQGYISSFGRAYASSEFGSDYRMYITENFNNNNSVFNIVCIDEPEMYSFSEKMPSFYISRDNGVHYEPITPDELFYFNDSISPRDNKLRLKVKIPIGTRLLNYGITWA